MAAAQQTQASKLLFNEDELLQFVTHLRTNDFTIGSDQIINLYDLLLAYATQQKLPADPLQYASLIAPIVCQNPSDQQRFSHLWQQWLRQHGLLDETSTEKIRRDAAADAQSPDDITRRTRFWPYLLLGACLVVSAIILSPYIEHFITDYVNNGTTPDTKTEVQQQVDNTPPPEAPEPQPKPQLSELDKLLSVSGGEITQMDDGFGKGEKITAISADGRYLLTGNDIFIRERERKTGFLWDLYIKTAFINVRYSKGGKYLIFKNPDEAIEIWRRSDGKKVYTSDHYFSGVEFSRDDRLAVIYSEEKIIILEFLEDKDARELYVEDYKGARGVEKAFGSVSIYDGIGNSDRAMILASVGLRYNNTDNRDWQGFIELSSIDGELISRRPFDSQDTDVLFTPDGKGFISYHKAGTLSYWQLPEYSDIEQLKKTPSVIVRATTSASGTGVLAGLRPVTIKLNTNSNENFHFLNNQTLLYQHNGQCKQLAIYKPAIKVRPTTQTGYTPKCPTGAFYDPSGACYRCPPGGRRTASLVTSNKACQIIGEEQCSGPGMAIWHIPSRQVYDISEKLGIPSDKLTTATNAGRYISYIVDRGLLPLEKQSFWQRPEARYSVPVVPAVLLLIWILWNARRRRLWLKRRETGGSADLETLHVTYDDHGLWQNESLKRGLQRLRLYQYQPSRRLNVPASVEATVRQGGFFRSVFSHRPVQPEYLLLIDQVHVRDFQRLLIDAWVRRLRDEGLHVSAWYFYQDLRMCYAEKGTRVLNIEELAARYDNYRLLVVSDVEGLFDPLSGEPVEWLRTLKSWQDRAVMTPRAGELWGHREVSLNREGFAIVPIDEAGFEVLGDYFTTAPDNRVSGAPVLRPFNVVPLPPIILRNADRWLRESPASEQQVKRLFREVREYLGEDAYLLLCASAVYPVIDWNMTLYLDQVLSNHNGNLEPRHQKLLRLSRLPWFRHANMPDYLRLVFIQSMSRQQEKQVRRAIQSLLKSALTPTGKRFDLEFAVGNKSGSTRWLRDFLRTLPPEDVLHDHIFISMMKGRRASKLNMALPRVLNRLFPGKVARVKRLFTGIALLLAITTLAALWIYWPTLFPVPYTATINTLALEAKEIEPQKETTPPKEEPKELKEAISALSARNVAISKQLKQLEKLDSYKSYDEYEKFAELKSAVEKSIDLFNRQELELSRFRRVFKEFTDQDARLRAEFNVLIQTRKKIIATIANTLYKTTEKLYGLSEILPTLGGGRDTMEMRQKSVYLGNYAVEIMSSVFGEKAEETKLIKQKLNDLIGNKDPFAFDDSTYSFYVDSSPYPVIISFWSSTSSENSGGVKPVLDDVAFRYSKKYRFGKLDITKNPQTANRYGVKSIPLVILTEKGKEIARIAGITSGEQLEEWIRSGFKKTLTTLEKINAPSPPAGRKTETLKVDKSLDATGLNVPLPILRAKKELIQMRPGQVLEVIATDPGSPKDFEAFAKQTGHELIQSKQEDGKFIFLLRKSGSTEGSAAGTNTDQQQLLEQANSNKAPDNTTAGKRYYVIAMTSSKKGDIQNEIDRVRKKVQQQGRDFNRMFPDIEAYAPDNFAATLLISGKSLSYEQANKLKKQAIAAGFSSETWLWESTVAYFSEKTRAPKPESSSQDLKLSDLRANLFSNGKFSRGFEAEYNLTRSTITIGTMKTTLSRGENGNYIYLAESVPKGLMSLFVSTNIRQTSEFAMEDYTIIPSSFAERRDDKSKNREYTIQYGGNPRAAFITELDTKRTMSVADPAGNTVDVLTLQLTLMARLVQQEKAGTIRDMVKALNLVTKLKSKAIVARYNGTQAIETELGNFTALAIQYTDEKEIRTTIWFARNLSYLPVRIERVEKDGTTITSGITSFRETGFNAPSSPSAVNIN